MQAAPPLCTEPLAAALAGIELSSWLRLRVVRCYTRVVEDRGTRRCAPSLEDRGRVPATLERLRPANARTLRLPLVTYDRTIVHRSSISHEAVSLIDFTDTVRLLAEQALRHYASPDCTVSGVGGGQGTMRTL